MRRFLFLEIMTFAWAIAILWLSLFYLPVGIPGDGSGFLLHLGAYFFLAVLAMHAYNHKTHLWPIVIIAVTYGIALEVLQFFVGRVPSVSDAIANMAGVITAAVLVQNIEKLNSKKKSKA